MNANDGVLFILSKLMNCYYDISQKWQLQIMYLRKLEIENIANATNCIINFNLHIAQKYCILNSKAVRFNLNLSHLDLRMIARHYFF